MVLQCCSVSSIQAARRCPPLPPPCSQPHINLVFAAELSYVQLLDCSAAVLQAGLGPAIALSACLPRQSGLLSLKNVWTSSSSAPSCGAAVHRAAVLQTKHAVPGLVHLSDSLIPSGRGWTLHNRVLLNTAIPTAQIQSYKDQILSQLFMSSYILLFFSIYLFSSQSTSARHLPALSACCTDCTQAARRGRGSNQAAIGDLNAAAASHVQCCS